jgi:hypothetical protein
VSGISVQPQISARNLTLKLNTVTNTKTGATLVINYPALYLSLAQSVLIDNQDATNPVTVRINRGVNTITINSSQNRAFNDAWIEQLDLTGASTNTQVTAQVAPLRQVRGLSQYETGVTN